MTAPISGIPASSAATAGLCLTDRTKTYCASQLTMAAAAASTASATIAPSSQPCARSRLGALPATCDVLLPGRGQDRGAAQPVPGFIPGRRACGKSLAGK